MDSKEVRSLADRLRTRRVHAGVSDGELMELARGYLAVHNAVVEDDGMEEELGDREFYRGRIDELYAICRERCSAGVELERRIPLVYTLYQLILNAYLRPVDYGKLGKCDETAYEVITGYLREVEAGRLAETPELVFGVCRVITELLYYADEEEREGEEMTGYFRRKLAEWVEELAGGDHWEGVAEEEALQRLTILERNAGMFLDHRYDEVVERVAGYYEVGVL